MAMITINGVQVEATPGRRLVEVIKEQGIAITNLCYIDGLEPYAGCRTCVVDIEGARPTSIQLSCTAQVAEGMVVTTDTPEVKRMRQSVMSMILANHPDRCLTCHRRVHCMPGDICLRDDVVTHRCLTCSKNYRCELQTSCELVDQGEFEEPWVGEPRSYYEAPPPEPDRANPFLEFDPQMCIICTRCVRACDELRHTGALTLAGKGFTTRIAFGTGGAVHESDCDFCGACIDVCPTATLMEKPNKWIGRADDWTNSVCNSCAVGCTISYGVNDNRPVVVRPDRINPVSRDQICVRGRFHYDAVDRRERLSRALVRENDRLLPATYEDAVARAVEALTAVKQASGGGAIAVLGSPLATNEEAFLLTRVAGALGTPHLDFSHGTVHRAVAEALRGAFGTDRLPSSLTELERADTIVVIATDLEETHPVASLRIKDAVTKRRAKLVVVSPRWGELVPFAEAWIQPRPGAEAQAAQALADAIGGGSTGTVSIEGPDAAALERAVAALRAGAEASAAEEGGERPVFSVVFAPNATEGALAGDRARAAVNIAITARGEDAAHHVHYLPTDANVNGIADMGVAPGAGGRAFPEIIEAAKSGSIKAMLIHADNPLLNAPGTADIRAALEGLEALVVVDSVRSTAAEYATVVLPEVPFFARTGTITSGDRRILRQRPAAPPQRDDRDGIAVLGELASRLGASATYDDAGAVMAEIAASVPGYMRYEAMGAAPGEARALDTAVSLTAKPQPLAGAGTPVAAAEAAPETRSTGNGRRRSRGATAESEAAAGGDGGMTVFTSRPLYTSWEGASIRSEEADKLHREEHAWLNPRDAQELGVRAEDEITLTDGTSEVLIRVRLDDGVAAGTVYVPSYYDGGAVMALFPLGGGAPAANVRVRAMQPA